MMTVAVGLMAGMFIVAIQYTGLIQVTLDSLRALRESYRAMVDGDLTDDEKERVARQGSIQMLKYTGSILLRTGACCLAPALVAIAFIVPGLISGEQLLIELMDWRKMLVLSLAYLVVFYAFRFAEAKWRKHRGEVV